MSWVLVVKILILMLAAGLIAESMAAALIDKRRESDIKRKEAGL